MTFENRRRFMGMTVAAVVTGTLSGQAVAAQSKGSNERSTMTKSVSTMPLYLVVHRRGPKWVDGRAMSEQQGMREHFRYYLDLYRAGRLRDGGAFADGSGGAAIFEAVDDAAAEAFIASDPAVVSGVFQSELKQWRPNPWEEISKKYAAQGQ